MEPEPFLWHPYHSDKIMDMSEEDAHAKILKPRTARQGKGGAEASRDFQKSNNETQVSKPAKKTLKKQTRTNSPASGKPSRNRTNGRKSPDDSSRISRDKQTRKGKESPAKKSQGRPKKSRKGTAKGGSGKRVKKSIRRGGTSSRTAGRRNKVSKNPRQRS